MKRSLKSNNLQQWKMNMNKETKMMIINCLSLQCAKYISREIIDIKDDNLINTCSLEDFTGDNIRIHI